MPLGRRSPKIPALTGQRRRSPALLPCRALLPRSRPAGRPIPHHIRPPLPCTCSGAPHPCRQSPPGTGNASCRGPKSRAPQSTPAARAACGPALLTPPGPLGNDKPRAPKSRPRQLGLAHGMAVLVPVEGSRRAPTPPAGLPTHVAPLPGPVYVPGYAAPPVVLTATQHASSVEFDRENVLGDARKGVEARG